MHNKNFVIKTKYTEYDSNFLHNHLIDLKFNNKFIFCCCFEDLQDKDEIDLQWLIEEILYIKNYLKSFSKKFIFLIDGHNEAPTYFTLKNQINYIKEKTFINLKDILLVTDAFNHNDQNIKYSHCFGVALVYTKEILDSKTFTFFPKYHFVSMARLAKIHRILATVEIIDRGLEKYGNCSLGCGYRENKNENNLMMKKIFKKYNHRFPLYIEEEILDSASWEKKLKLKAENEKISHAFVNFVLETSYEPIDFIESWSSPFITEKSLKPFAWGQVPIFLNCANSLCKLRDFGFDLFDDIINHDYDNEKNPLKRIKLTVDELEKICKWTLEDCINFKKNNMDRFIKNRKLLEKLYQTEFFQINKNNLQIALDSYDITSIIEE